MRAFLERIKRCFSTDLNSDWDSWPRSQRKNLVTRFLRGLTKEDYDHTSTPKDRDTLAAKSWDALVLEVVKVDRIIGPRARRFTRLQQQVNQTSHVPGNPAGFDAADHTISQPRGDPDKALYPCPLRHPHRNR